jgi:hypothetical protein
MVHELTRPQLADHLDGLPKHRPPIVRAWPSAPGHVLVQPLPGAHTEEESILEHRASRGSGLRDDRRVHPYGRAGHRGAHFELVGHGRDASQDGPHEGALALGVDPGMEVIGDRGEIEADLFGSGRVGEELGRGPFFRAQFQPEAHRDPSIRGAATSA